MAVQHAVENRQVWLDAGAGQGVVLEAEQFARGFVGQHDPAGMVQGQDGQGAGFDQDADLLFGLFAQQDLRLAFGEVFGQIAAALVEGGDKEAGHGVAGDATASRSLAPGANCKGSKTWRRKAQNAAISRICQAFKAEAASRMGKRYRKPMETAGSCHSTQAMPVDQRAGDQRSTVGGATPSRRESDRVWSWLHGLLPS